MEQIRNKEILSNSEIQTGSANKTDPQEPKSFLELCREWRYELRDVDGFDFFATMFLYPAFVIIAIFGFTGIEVNIPLVYLIVDPLVIRLWVTTERKRRASLVVPDNYLHHLHQMLDEINAEEARANPRPKALANAPEPTELCK